MVLSGQAVDLRIAAQVAVSKGYTPEAIQNSFYPLLQEYCSQIAFHSQIISYLGMVHLIFDCPGVIDVINFQLNGEAKSIQLLSRQFPVAQIPEITVEVETDA